MVATIKQKCQKVLAFFILFGFCLNILSAQNKIYVDSSAVSGGTGASWADAYSDLQDALSTAAIDDTIWVAQGTYFPSTSDRTAYFEIPHNTYIYGGFDGSETLLEQRDITTNVTILSGDIDMDGTVDGNSYTIVYMKLLCYYSLLDGFTIIDGHADDDEMTGDEINKNGGAVYIDGGATNGGIPVFLNCKFIDNYALKFGGAIYANGISGGYAHYVVESCEFIDNKAINGGGAIYNDGECSPAIFNSNFVLNASTYGGAIYNSGVSNICSPSIVNCIFEQNRAYSIGGALYNFGKNATGESSPWFVNCLVYNNLSDASAGGLYSIADDGVSEMQVINSTFYNNVGAGNGGHIYTNESNAGTTLTTVRNSIFWNSNSGFSPYFAFSESGGGTPEINLDYCLVDADECDDMIESAVGTLTCGANMIYNEDPLFVNTTSGTEDFRLQDIASPAVDAGNQSFLPLDLLDLDEDGDSTEFLPIDLDWNVRLEGAEVDLGPYELNSPPAPLGALPIELLSFDARPIGGKVSIEWATLTEENNEFFTVERSVNGLDFEAIRRVEGAGTSTHARNYQIYDENPFAGETYYRLKQTDFDGRFEYSDIKVVQLLEEGQLTTYPNPVTEVLHIALSGFSVREVNYEIYHFSGKMMYSGVSEVNEGVVVISFEDIDQLLPGSYIIRIVNEKSGDLYGKFLKVTM